MKRFFANKKKYLVLLGVVALVAILIILSGRSSVTDEIEIRAVSRGEVEEIVSETGFVQPTQAVSLAFEYGGRVISIPIQEGDVVEEGSVLLELDASERTAQLAGARAQLQSAQIRLNELISGADAVSLDVSQSSVVSAQTAVESAKSNLLKVTAQHDQLVANAQKTLLTSGLQAYLSGNPHENSSYSYTPPTISGTYNSTEEGTYVLDIYSSNSSSGSSFKLSGLESGIESISTNNALPVGTRGLYIQFPENFAKGSTITWEIPIPNTRSSVYQTNLNSYNASLETRDLAIKTAENTLKSAEAALAQANNQFTQVSSSARDEQVEAQRAVVRQMQAVVEAAEIAVSKMTLRAPFTGIVTSIAVETGEIVSPSFKALNLISNENFELIVNVSESDIQEITIGDSAKVIFDAYDDGRFQAKVTQISPNAEILDGVRAFKITLQFSEKNEQIKAGLSADVDIIAAHKTDVLVVPTRAVVEKEDGKFVRAMENDSLTYIPVQTGLRGSNGMTEIVSGLEEGTQVITFANQGALEKLETK